MAETKDNIFEEESCMNCGEINYHSSKVNGLCLYCASLNSSEE
jgi:formylmethanofuran dehydrogenase subunit E